MSGVSSQCPPAAAPAASPPAAAVSGNMPIIIAGVVAGILLLFLVWWNFFGSSGSISNLPTFLIQALIGGGLVFVLFFIIYGISGDPTSTGNLAPSPLDSGTGGSISGSALPMSAGTNGGNYGIQWWMYVKDWNYKFGEEKPVLSRGTPGGLNPYVFLHPTENSLCVRISVFSGASGGAESSAPAPIGGDGSATDDSFTCKLDNIPLQSWFCVNLSVSGRNVDIYLNGLLVRSCLLPGVPKTPSGDLQLMPNGGFSGNIIDLYHQSRALTPNDAKTFCSRGTNGKNYNELPSKSLFGYNVKFTVNDSVSGREIKQYTL